MSWQAHFDQRVAAYHRRLILGREQRTRRELAMNFIKIVIEAVREEQLDGGMPPWGKFARLHDLNREHFLSCAKARKQFTDVTRLHEG